MTAPCYQRRLLIAPGTSGHGAAPRPHSEHRAAAPLRCGFDNHQLRGAPVKHALRFQQDLGPKIRTFEPIGPGLLLGSTGAAGQSPPPAAARSLRAVWEKEDGATPYHAVTAHPSPGPRPLTRQTPPPTILTRGSWPAPFPRAFRNGGSARSAAELAVTPLKSGRIAKPCILTLV